MKRTRIKGKAALVTGASRGLGAEIASELARLGARVVMTARGASTLEQAKQRILATGGEVYALTSDIGQKLDIHPLVGAATALVGPIDILVNNASILGPVPLRLLLDTECEDFERVLAVNLLGPFRLSRIVAGSMALRGQGTIVNISSDAAVSAYPHWGAYSVSKAALDHLSRIWAAELEGHGVRVISVDPGEMDTQMHRDAIPDADQSTLADPGKVARQIVRLIEREDLASNGRFEASQLEEANDSFEERNAS